MKTFLTVLFLLSFLSSYSQESSERQLKSSKSFNLQIGASGGFGSVFAKTTFIPYPGIDMCFGTLGLRGSGQFFNTTPEFDISGYLKPIISEVTQSNLRENNSNTLLGLTPYVNVGKKAINLQAGIGVKYLIQKSASTKAIYTPDPNLVMLEYSAGQLKSSVLMIEPNLRLVFGKPGSVLRFYIEGCYTLPVGKTEFNYVTRGDLTTVIDPKTGLIVKKYLDASKLLVQTGKAISAFTTVGGGITLNIFSKGVPEKVIMDKENNYYGKNNVEIRRTTKTDHIGTYHFKPQNYADELIETVKDKNGNLVYLYSYLWVRNCPDPPGGQEYFSYVLDRGYTYIKYEGCTGGYNEWFYSTLKPNNNDYMSDNNTINALFNNVIRVNKHARELCNITDKEFGDIILIGFLTSIDELEKKGDKGLIMSSFENITQKRIVDLITDVNVRSIGRGEIGGKESVTYLTGTNNAQVVYESDLIPDSESKNKESKKITVLGTTSLNGMKGFNNGNSAKYFTSLLDSVNFSNGSMNQSIYTLIGEPVPGAEIYVELEPDDEPIINSISDSSSFYELATITPTVDTVPRNIEISIKLTKSCFPLIKQNGEEYIGKGIYTFGVGTLFNNKKQFNEFAIVVNEPTLNITCMTGPFSQSLSNIEVNGKRMNPYVPRKVEVGVKVFLMNSFLSVNNYGINDDGIKRTSPQPFTSVNNYGINDDGIKRTIAYPVSFGSKTGKNPLKINPGKPVPGAKVYIEFESDDAPMDNVTTDENGEFYVTINNNPLLPSVGTLILTILPTKKFANEKGISLTNKQKIKVEFNRNDGPVFRFVLWWKADSKTANRGSFAVSGKSDT